ncbi:hypothetical protein LSH36_246g04045 [Paralvinella palmiformis]|uniref:Transporter n=1 Tax=Paralvinella palmiformis TaxID=53620 RepID=A0AAD9JL48_9ANNE|nr:hypothetical protein LSH36_246g04045 [Paralvinella palmiformis]
MQCPPTEGVPLVGVVIMKDTKDGDVSHRRRRRYSSGGNRETWTRKVEYLFAALGYAVGLGNIWRFPYLCYRNGGGAFLFPYFIALILVGFPVLFLEMAFGQFASLGTLTIWRISPLFKGIGFAIIIVMMLINTYYNVLNAYALYYMFASITNELPWSQCGQKWNTNKCTAARCPLFVRGVTLPGSLDGIIYYLKPDFKALGRLEVWGEAGAQLTASLTLGGGGWITLSSYNRFRNNCGRDAILVGIGNALTSLYSGFVIFSVLGYMAWVKGVDVDVVTRKGSGLAFIAYPEGLALIPGAPFWAICFFFMMFTVGLDSLFGQVETIASGIIDEYPDLLRPHRKLFTGVLCTFMFLLGIPFVTQGGMYIVTLMDWYSLLLSFSIISLFEIIVVIYVYGYKQFAGDIEVMLGHKPSYYYMVTWYGITPITILLIIAFLAAKNAAPTYGSYQFPPYALHIGWVIALCPCSLILLTMIIQFFKRVHTTQDFKDLIYSKDDRREIVKSLTSPTIEWGPALPEDRHRYSSSSSFKKHHPSGDTQGTQGSDDVFANAVELQAITVQDKDRLVHFEDESKKKENERENKEADNQKAENDDNAKDDNKLEDEEKQLLGKKDVEKS